MEPENKEHTGKVRFEEIAPPGSRPIPEHKIEPEIKTEPEKKVDPEKKVELEVKVEPEKKTDPITKVEPEIKTDTVDYAKRVSELEAELTTLKTQPPPVTIKNPLYHKLSVIESESPDEVPLFHEILFGNPDSVKLWKIGFMQDNPKYKDRPDDVQLLLEDKYPILFDHDADKESSEYKVATMKFDIEVSKVKDRFDERLNKITPPDTQAQIAAHAEAEKAAMNTLTESWKSDFGYIAGDFKKIKFTAELEDNNKAEFEFEIPLDKQKQLLESAAVYVLHNKMQKTPESIEKVRNFMTDKYFAENRTAILNHVVRVNTEKVSKERDSYWTKKTNNNKPLGQNNLPPGKTANSQREFVDKLTGK